MALIEALLGMELLPVLVATLGRLAEPDDSDAIHNVLAVVENIIEASPDVYAERVVAGCELLGWLLAQLKGKKFTPNKQYVSEVLAMLLLQSTPNRTRFGELDGVERCLQRLAQYRKRDPGSQDEGEMMENLFDVVCSALRVPENRTKFVAAEGIDLMVLVLRERKQSQHGAVKVLDHALSGKGGVAGCALFVERLGLRSLFPAFMRTPSSNKGQFSKAAFEEHVASILASLMRSLGDQALVDRLLRKFVEQDFAKLERLVDLHLTHAAKVRAVDVALAAEAAARAAEPGMAEDEDEVAVRENDAFLRRMDAGLSALQHLDTVIGELCMQCGSAVRDRVRQLLKLKRGSIATVTAVLDELADNIGDGDPDETAEEAAARVSRIRKLAVAV